MNKKQILKYFAQFLNKLAQFRAQKFNVKRDILMEELNLDSKYLFDQIDVNSKGFITEYDLNQFFEQITDDSNQVYASIFVETFGVNRKIYPKNFFQIFKQKNDSQKTKKYKSEKIDFLFYQLVKTFSKQLLRLNKKRGFIKNFIITRKDCNLIQIFETIKKNIYSDEINVKQLYDFIQKNGFLIKDYEFECLCIDLKSQNGIRYSLFEQLFENDYFFQDLIIENVIMHGKENQFYDKKYNQSNYMNLNKLKQMDGEYDSKVVRTVKLVSQNIKPIMRQTQMQKILYDCIFDIYKVIKNNEKIKNELIMQVDFNLFQCYELIDINRKGMVYFVTFHNFMNQMCINKQTSQDIELFYKKFDSDQDGCLQYSDYVRLMTPYQKYYQKILQQKQQMFQSFEFQKDLSTTTITINKQFFKSVFESIKKIEKIKLDYLSKMKQQLYDGYSSIDRQGQGVDLDLFYSFISTHEMKPIELEYKKSIFEMFDCNQDQIIDFDDFKQTLSPLLIR